MTFYAPRTLVIAQDYKGRQFSTICFTCGKENKLGIKEVEQVTLFERELQRDEKCHIIVPAGENRMCCSDECQKLYDNIILLKAIDSIKLMAQAEMQKADSKKSQDPFIYSKDDYLNILLWLNQKKKGFEVRGNIDTEELVIGVDISDLSLNENPTTTEDATKDPRAIGGHCYKCGQAGHTARYCIQ